MAPAMTNLSVVLESKGNLKVKDAPEPPPPAAHEVQVSMRSVGICGSDCHYWTKGRIGDFIVKEPMVLGHEGSGVVCAVGEKVKHLKVGDPVALEPGVPCMQCEQCRTGRYNLCAEVTFHATPPVNGTLARRVNHAAAFCYKLPPGVSLDAACMIEPLSVGMHAVKRGEVRCGDSVFIAGAGPVGLMCVLAARAAGATKIVISDIDQARLDVATKVVDGTHNALTDDAKSLSRSFHVCIDCSGAQPAVASCIANARNGGVVVLVGMGEAEMKLPILDALIREVDLRGVFRYANTYQRALDLVANGTINAEWMITHRFDLKDSVKAFETCLYADKTKSIKVIIDCGNE